MHQTEVLAVIAPMVLILCSLKNVKILLFEKLDNLDIAKGSQHVGSQDDGAQIILRAISCVRATMEGYVYPSTNYWE